MHDQKQTGPQPGDSCKLPVKFIIMADGAQFFNGTVTDFAAFVQAVENSLATDIPNPKEMVTFKLHRGACELSVTIDNTGLTYLVNGDFHQFQEMVADAYREAINFIPVPDEVKALWNTLIDNVLTCEIEGSFTAKYKHGIVQLHDGHMVVDMRMPEMTLDFINNMFADANASEIDEADVPQDTLVEQN